MAETLPRIEYLRAAIYAALEEHREEINSATFMEELAITVKFKNGVLRPSKCVVRPTFEHYLSIEENVLQLR